MSESSETSSDAYIPIIDLEANYEQNQGIETLEQGNPQIADFSEVTLTIKREMLDEYFEREAAKEIKHKKTKTSSSSKEKLKHKQQRKDSSSVNSMDSQGKKQSPSDLGSGTPKKEKVKQESKYPTEKLLAVQKFARDTSSKDSDMKPEPKDKEEIDCDKENFFYSSSNQELSLKTIKTFDETNEMFMSSSSSDFEGFNSSPENAVDFEEVASYISVSSVHTSDLSSFEEELSDFTENGKSKKKLTIKEAEERMKYINSQKEWEVEKILRKKVRPSRGGEFYLLKWEGFPSSDNSWEPKENLNCPELLEEFEKRHRHQKFIPQPKKRKMSAYTESSDDSEGGPSSSSSSHFSPTTSMDAE